MRGEILGSALLHGGIVAFALIWMGLPSQEDAPAMGSVTVDLIGASLVTSNQSETVESDAVDDQVSSGAEVSIAPVAAAEIAEVLPVETVQPVMDIAEALPVDRLEPVAEPIREAQPAEPMEALEPVTSAEPGPADPAEALEPLPPVEAEPVLAVAALALDSEEAVAPAQSARLEPETVTEAKLAPVPHVLSFTRPDAPTRQQVAAPAPTRQQAPPPQQAGNGGASSQDTAAALSTGGQNGAGSGGNADIARYPGQVERKVGRALRYPREARSAAGEAEVFFVLNATGQLVRLSLRRSSGNAVIDQAALDTVQRAAPFPPFPAGADRAQWEFSIPLHFAR